MRARIVDKWPKKTALGLGLCVILMGSSLPLRAAGDVAPGHSSLTYATLDGIDVKKKYVLGVSRFDLDTHTEIIGWRISNDWYFGRQDGLDSGLTLVWQQAANQISLSKDGVRLTRRF